MSAVEPVGDQVALERLAAPPGGDIGQLQILAQQAPRQRGQETQQSARFDHTRARHVGHRHAAAADRLDQARHAQARGAVQLQRIDEVGVNPAPDDVGAFEAGDGAHVHAPVAGDQVLAFDQQEAKVAGQVRLLEIGLAVGARRQDTDAWIAARRRLGQAIAEGAEEGRQSLDVGGVVEAGIGPRHHQPVLQRIAGARRRLGTVVQHPPAPIRAPADVDGEQVEPAPARRLDPAHGADVVGAAGDGGGRQMALGDQPRLAVEVAQQGLHESGALLHAGDDLGPLPGAQQQWQRIDRPGALRILAIDAVGDAGVADVPGGQLEPLVQLLARQLGQATEELQPIGSRFAVRADQLVRYVRQRPIGAQPVLQPRRLTLTPRHGQVSLQPASSGPTSSETRPPAPRAAGPRDRQYGRDPGIAPAGAPALRRNSPDRCRSFARQGE